MIRATFSSQTLLLEFYNDHYIPERLVPRNSPPVTHAENRRVIGYFSVFLERPATVDDLGKENFLAYRDWRIAGSKRKGKGQISSATVNKDLRILAALERFLYDEFGDQLGLQTPRRIRKLNEYKRQPEAYTLEQISAVLASAMQETETIAGVPAALWWSSQLATFYDTGYRRRALLNSRWSDLDRERAVLRRPGEEQKHRADQAQALHPDTIKLIESIRRPTREKIWPWPFRGHGPWYKRLHAILERAGLSRIPRKPAHALRASHATYLAEVAGLEAAARSCGHSSSRVTLKHYVDATIPTASRPTALLPRPDMPNVDQQRRLFQ